MTDKYILNAAGNPVPEPDLLKWASWYENADRRIGSAEIGEAHVSTVFLGVDHGFDPSLPPLLFETMVFWKGHDLDQEQDRYATREEALAGHEAMVARVKAAVT